MGGCSFFSVAFRLGRLRLLFRFPRCDGRNMPGKWPRSSRRKTGGTTNIFPFLLMCSSGQRILCWLWEGNYKTGDETKKAWDVYDVLLSTHAIFHVHADAVHILVIKAHIEVSEKEQRAAWRDSFSFKLARGMLMNEYESTILKELLDVAVVALCIVSVEGCIENGWSLRLHVLTESAITSKPFYVQLTTHRTPKLLIQRRTLSLISH